MTIRCVVVSIAAPIKYRREQPRIKKFIDCDGQTHEIEVFRYYCRNPECA